MVRVLTRIASVVLILLVVTTLSLYAISNIDVVVDVLKKAAAAVKRDDSPEPSGDLSASGTPPSPSQTGGQKEEPKEPVEGVSIYDGDEEFLPFPYPDALAALPQDSEQAVLVLGTGMMGNLWVLERHDGTWYNLRGPLYCRIGRNGLGDAHSAGDNVTPTGVSYIGALYTPKELEGIALTQLVYHGGDVWVTDADAEDYNRLSSKGAASYKSSKSLSYDANALYLAVGFNRDAAKDKGAGIFLQAAASLGGGTDGSIALSYEHMRSVALWLDPERKPVLCALDTAEVGWTVETGVNENFVYLTDVVPGIKEEVRYATSNNFMGRPIKGYYGARILVLKEVAEALAQVQSKLEEQGLGLLVYDGYRPKRAVDDIFSWMKDLDDTLMKAQFYPEIDKGDLRGIYLAEHSPHTYGIAVDLTIIDNVSKLPLDMGTEFDFFSPLSWYAAEGITPAQAENRKLLKDVMTACGFEPYEKEWWHFNFSISGKKTAYDFVIPQ